ncbi:MAG: redox-regulated ATPase YchF [Patescibacteria group bacterium]|nr:redox-regulated ATPase YchF [Patescibacteria group bacterium]
MVSVGIIGLPNVGKSTIFNALVKSNQAQSSNYPFTTIEPNVGIVEVPDERLDKLAEIEKSKKVVPALIKFVDIAGLVKGASEGAGLGNKFLSHIKEVDAVVMVVRCFENENITHVSGKVNPEEDIKIINLELILADFEQVSKAVERVSKEAKSGNKEIKKKLEILEEIKKKLEEEAPIRDLGLVVDDMEMIKDIQLITNKPIFYIANVAEEQLNMDLEELGVPSDSIKICARLENDLNSLSEEEKKEYLESVGAALSGRPNSEGAHAGAPLQDVIKRGYQVLNLISFLTAGEMESRAWTIKKGFKAPQAAGVIHGDFEKKFIAADVIPYEKFVEASGWVHAREKGWVRTEGKEYEMKDGDVVIFRHG